ncbi:HvfC/BufC N-terminal domain-containing protein [Hydrogenothermus marinus]|uniref:Putative DNA-binding domain-containing protein n=1 Tax=Hydrogenothermus marinus TaxID=133270 RepID=A0A3M0BTF1_9AQUI|nr:putative DNA-binding domain-containing protein [Hydrogenothermus marinus]RMA97815.1 hypothetical protein CLV39_0444 [Hydrogenothermus marinus]
MKKNSFEIIEKFYKSIIYGENLLNLPENRLSIYQSLVYNNIEDSCAKAFPLTKKILEDKWEKLISDFLKNHKFKSPYLWEVPKEFISFLKNKGIFEEKSFLYELMLYEWLEIEIFNEDIPSVNREFNWYEKYNFSKTSKLLNFKYPIHKISEIDIKKIEDLKADYFLIIFQNPDTYEIEYLEITPFLYQILDNINSEKLINQVKQVCKSFNINYEDILPKLENFFKMLIKNKILI